MTILKSEQILADSPVSWEDAVDSAIKRFASTVRHVRSAYVNELTTVIEDGGVKTWRVNLQVTFEVDQPARTRTPVAAASTRTSARTSASKPKKSKSRKSK